MTDQSDWQAANASLMAEGRKRIEPPTVEEIEAYFEGTLPDEDAERVRERLTYYPELARVMTQAAPDENVRVLNDLERARDWKAIRRKLDEPRRRIALIAAAAVAGVVLAAVLISRAPSPAPPPPPPPQVATYQLRPDGIAGPTQRPLRIERCDRCILRALAAYAGEYPSYRMELLDLSTTPPRTIIRRPVQRDPRDGAYAIELRGLAPGFYRLELYGVREGAPERRGVYTVEVVGR